MGNLCIENKNIDEGNFQSETKPVNNIINCETKINQNSIPNLSEKNPSNNSINNINNNNNININNEINYNIPSNPPLIPNNIIPENIINSSKKLKLIILQSKYLPEGKEYLINAGGLIGSKRNIKDGITYFGDISVSLILLILFFFYFFSLSIKTILNFRKMSQKLTKLARK